MSTVEDILASFLAAETEWLERCGPDLVDEQYERDIKAAWELHIQNQSLDNALELLSPDELAQYEDAIELWIRYGGD